MRSWIKNLSHTAELLLVVMLVFGLFVFSSVTSFIAAPQGSVAVSDADLQFLVTFELLTMALAGYLLALRGWTLSAIGFNPTWGQTAIGAGLAIATLLAHGILATLLAPDGTQSAMTTDPVTPATALSPMWIALTSMINPLYEEVFVAGYLISAVKERRPAWVAITASVVLRTLYHLYQGIAAATGIALVGIIFAIFYHRTRQLWPLIVAHAVLDLLALSSLQGPA